MQATFLLKTDSRTGQKGADAKLSGAAVTLTLTILSLRGVKRRGKLPPLLFQAGLLIYLPIPY